MPGIDLHTHLAPRIWPGDTPPGPPKLYEPDALESWLDAVGLDGALVSPPPPFYRQGLPVDEAAAWVRALNDGTKELLIGRVRLRPAAYLPLEHPELALHEAERLLDDETFVAFTGSAGGRSVPLDDEALSGLWRLLAQRGRAIMLHPGQSQDQRLDRYYLSNLLGNPYETGVAAAQLLLGDVLGSTPDLRVLLVHCGGVLPSVLPRWQQGIDTGRPGLRPLSRPLNEALRGIWVDALAHDPAVVRQALDLFGRDRVVLGSDWPFPMGLQDPVDALSAVTGASFTDIGCTNADALIGAHAAWQRFAHV